MQWAPFSCWALRQFACEFVLCTPLQRVYLLGRTRVGGEDGTFLGGKISDEFEVIALIELNEETTWVGVSETHFGRCNVAKCLFVLS